MLTGTIESLPKELKFQSIIYIDVLEHIENDHEEIKKAVAHLNVGGKIIIHSPAHNFLYSPFDKSIGHFRRYNKKMLRNLILPNLREEKLIYLDAVGFFASLGNRFLLNSDLPTPNQIAIWDKVLVRLSKKIDPLLLHTWGKSIMGVWSKTQ